MSWFKVGSNTKRCHVTFEFLILDHLTDTELESQSIVQTVISTARDPNRILAFNMASQALNNSFFLDNLVSGGEKKIATALNTLFSGSSGRSCGESRG